MLTNLVHLVLLPATLALNVPIGCVKIRNRNFEGYLVKGDLYGEEQRNVAYGASAEQWHIRKGIEGWYKVTNMDVKEELFESELIWKGHRVFTRPLELGVEDGLWEIVPGSRYGYFKMKNAGHRDCLALSVRGILNLIVISAYPECDGKEFEWQFEKVKCADESFVEYDETET
uniref:Putative conserved secreted protein n=1 Tax=Culex tarsalis TaxID=7177 RepID=A0A1Q3FTV6_CULTA